MVKSVILLLIFLTIKSNCHLVSLSPGEIDKPLIINVPNVNGEIYRCGITRSDDADSTESKWSINSSYWSTKLEHIGAKNNSCSFEIITVNDGWLGKWIVNTFYKDLSTGRVQLIHLVHKYEIKSKENVIKLN